MVPPLEFIVAKLSVHAESRSAAPMPPTRPGQFLSAARHDDPISKSSHADGETAFISSSEESTRALAGKETGRVFRVIKRAINCLNQRISSYNQVLSPLKYGPGARSVQAEPLEPSSQGVLNQVSWMFPQASCELDAGNPAA